MNLPLSLLLAATAIAQEGSSVPKYQFQRDEVDTIQPVKISHHVDEIKEGDELVQRYNYVVYEFETKGAYLWARTYLHEVDKVAFFGPFADSSRATMVSAPSFEIAVVNYLKRRFHSIDRFNPDEKAHDPYLTIWRRSAPD